MASNPNPFDQPPISEPSAAIIRHAEAIAATSPCAKSRRGVVVFLPSPNPEDCGILGAGTNSPPRGAPCPGRQICGEDCRRLCVHPEIRAIREAIQTRPSIAEIACDLLHVKIGEDDRVVSGGPPSCWPCAREILDVRFIAGVWLYEEDPGAYRARARAIERSLIQPTLNGSEISRFSEIRAMVENRDLGTWRRYSVEEFYRMSVQNALIGPKIP